MSGSFSRVWLVLLVVGLALYPPGPLTADEINAFYEVSSVEAPDGLSNQVGGMDFTPDGRLAACFHRGEVYMINSDAAEGKS